MEKRKNIGLPPGFTIYTGNDSEEVVYVNYLEYDENQLVGEKDRTLENLKIHSPDPKKVQWYDIRGLHDEQLIKEIGGKFGMHPLAMEDAVDIRQRPSYSEYQDSHFITMRFLDFNQEECKLSRQAVSIYFGEGYVLTFQEKNDDLFAHLRQRINSSAGRIRQRKADYLAYALMDYIVDHYFHTLDSIDEEVEKLEEDINSHPEENHKFKIFSLKKELLKLRKSVAPLREAISLFSRTESKVVDERTIAFLRDVYEHVIHIVDNIDSMREIMSGLQDLFLSEISMKMNRIMQFLTIITALFVPLSFLAGLYGMNFEFMPELKAHYGYFILLGVMLFIVITMLFFFKKKKWL